MKNFKNYCSVFASIIALSTNVYAQDLLELELPTPEPTPATPASTSAATSTSATPAAPAASAPAASAPAASTPTQITPSTTPATTSVVNIFPFQAPQSTTPVVAQQPVAVPVVVQPTPAPAPAPVVVVEDPAPAPEAAPEPCHEPVTVGFRGMLGICRFSERSMESGHNVDYQTTIDILQPSANEVFLPLLEGGIVIDIPFHHYFAISTGVLYSQKSNYRKCHIDSTNFKSDNAIITRIGYIKIPGQVTLRNWTTENTRFDISAGPYVAFGIHGKVKEKYVSDVNARILQETENKIDVFDESVYDNVSQTRVAPYKRFDFGFCFTTTFEFKKYCVGANFDMGLTDITKPEHTEGNTRTRAIGIFFGYMFR